MVTVVRTSNPKSFILHDYSRGNLQSKIVYSSWLQSWEPPIQNRLFFMVTVVRTSNPKSFIFHDYSRENLQSKIVYSSWLQSWEPPIQNRLFFMITVVRTSNPKSVILHGYSREDLESYSFLRVWFGYSLLRLYLCDPSCYIHRAGSTTNSAVSHMICSSKNCVGSNEISLLDYFICRKYDWMKWDGTVRVYPLQAVGLWELNGWMARLHISMRNRSQTEGKRQTTSVHGHRQQFSGLRGDRKFAYKLYISATQEYLITLK
jgi:hypothetical protein